MEVVLLLGGMVKIMVLLVLQLAEVVEVAKLAAVEWSAVELTSTIILHFCIGLC